MDGIKNFLMFVHSNWTTILVCAGLIVGIVKKSKNYFSKTKDEKIEIAKAQIQQIILKLITSAEIDFDTWNQAGSIKRSQVIEEVFAKYPILSKATNQDEVIQFIDEQINESLKTLRSIVKQNEESVAK